LYFFKEFVTLLVGNRGKLPSGVNRLNMWPFTDVTAWRAFSLDERIRATTFHRAPLVGRSLGGFLAMVVAFMTLFCL